MLSKHQAATQASQHSCDELLRQLRSRRGDVQRAEAKSVCGFHCKGHNRFAYFFHSAQSNRVYIRGEKSQELADRYATLGVSHRPTMKRGWADMYPLFWKVDDANLGNLATAILDLALPLTVKKARGKSVAPAEPVALPHEVLPSFQYLEGATKRIVVNAYERDRDARTACLAHFGKVCVVCGFDFGLAFGPEFAGVIEVHHLKPLSKIDAEYSVNPLSDLRPVCPNCHTALHRRDPPYEIDELRALLQRRK